MFEKIKTIHGALPLCLTAGIHFELKQMIFIHFSSSSLLILLTCTVLISNFQIHCIDTQVTTSKCFCNKKRIFFLSSSFPSSYFFLLFENSIVHFRNVAPGRLFSFQSRQKFNIAISHCMKSRLVDVQNCQ